MPNFDPQPGNQITINAVKYKIMPHPVVPDMAFGQEGRKAIVYQLQSNGQTYALKAFKPVFRDPSLVGICQTLTQLSMAGMEVCQRTCLTRDHAGPFLRQHPDLEYAILMPWVIGSTWFDMIVGGAALDRSASIRLAKQMADVLAGLETAAFAHCDVAGPNVIVNPQTGQVSLIDVEDMYGPGLPAPSNFPRGTDGYQHRASRQGNQGQWCLEGDRFSAAVLLAEMLAWHSPAIRKACADEHFFDSKELQEPGKRYDLMVATLKALSSGLADCFERAWHSTSLTDCPSLSEWAKLLEFPIISNWQPIVAPPPPAPYRPTFTPLLTEQTTTTLAAPAYCWVLGAPDGSGSLRWTPVTAATGYVVEAADSEDFVQGVVEVYRGADSTWKIVNPQARPRYYRVGAYDANGVGARSKVTRH